MTPTMYLRLVVRQRNPNSSEKAPQTIEVLQQLWAHYDSPLGFDDTLRCGAEWRDVPKVREA